jgi:hypothetical protein
MIIIFALLMQLLHCPVELPITQRINITRTPTGSSSGVPDRDGSSSELDFYPEVEKDKPNDKRRKSQPSTIVEVSTPANRTSEPVTPKSLPAITINQPQAPTSQDQPTRCNQGRREN